MRGFQWRRGTLVLALLGILVVATGRPPRRTGPLGADPGFCDHSLVRCPAGGRYASPMVVPPQVAIVGAGRIEKRPVVTADGQIAAHRVLPLSLTFDHRAATGGEAARFLNALKRALES